MIEKPSKLFPCDCMGEGIMVTPMVDDEDISEGEVKLSEDKELRDCQRSPFIQLSFWEFGVCKNPRWDWWWRLKIAWRVFRDGSAWPDQVIMKAAVARNLANHILYMISKAKKEIKLAEKQEPLQPIEELLKNPNAHNYFCIKHGGTRAGEIINIRNETSCPRCVPEQELLSGRIFKGKQKLVSDIPKLMIDDIGLDLIEKPHPMYCVSHGGSVAGEEINKKHSFKCPKCTIEEEFDLGK